jgi:AcrR family transcriptional regulator
MSSKKEETTQQRLFNAGIQVFAKRGYRDATVREICKTAGTANINAVNYYYGSKEGLYRKILEVIFSEYDRFDREDWDRKTPRGQLKTMISNFCAMLYKDNAFASDITSIFISEMTRPSAFIEELVDAYNRPRIRRHLKMFQDLLGEGATEDMARDCLVSVAGQLLYYSFAWPVFSRLFPEYSADERYEQWAAHVYEFSLGGIAAIRKQFLPKKEDTPWE